MASWTIEMRNLCEKVKAAIACVDTVERLDALKNVDTSIDSFIRQLNAVDDHSYAEVSALTLKLVILNTIGSANQENLQANLARECLKNVQTELSPREIESFIKYDLENIYGIMAGGYKSVCRQKLDFCDFSKMISSLPMMLEMNNTEIRRAVHRVVSLNNPNGWTRETRARSFDQFVAAMGIAMNNESHKQRHRDLQQLRNKEAQLSNVQFENQQLQHQLQEKTADVERLKQQMAAAQAEADAFQKRTTEMITNHMAELDRVKSENQQLQNQLEEKTAEVERLKLQEAQSRSEAQQANEARKHAGEDLKQAKEARKKANEDRSEATQGWRQANEGWSEATQGWRQADEDRRQANQGLRQANEDWSKENQQLRNRLEEKTAEVTRLNRQQAIGELQSAQRQEVQAAEAELQAAEAEFQATEAERQYVHDLRQAKEELLTALHENQQLQNQLDENLVAEEQSTVEIDDIQQQARDDLNSAQAFLNQAQKLLFMILLVWHVLLRTVIRPF